MDNDEKLIVKKGIKAMLLMGLTVGFLIFQVVALILMAVISDEKKQIQKRIEAGVDYLPVTITWTDCQSHTTRRKANGRWKTETRYNNAYSYTVDGVEYEKMLENVDYSVVVGEQEITYYNPNNPNMISGYRSAEEQAQVVNGVEVPLSIIFQVLAIVFLIIHVLILVKGKRRDRYNGRS